MNKRIGETVDRQEKGEEKSNVYRLFFYFQNGYLSNGISDKMVFNIVFVSSHLITISILFYVSVYIPSYGVIAFYLYIVYNGERDNLHDHKNLEFILYVFHDTALTSICCEWKSISLLHMFKHLVSPSEVVTYIWGLLLLWTTRKLWIHVISNATSSLPPSLLSFPVHNLPSRAIHLPMSHVIFTSNNVIACTSHIIFILVHLFLYIRLIYPPITFYHTQDVPRLFLGWSFLGYGTLFIL